MGFFDFLSTQDTSQQDEALKKLLKGKYGLEKPPEGAVIGPSGQEQDKALQGALDADNALRKTQAEKMPLRDAVAKAHQDVEGGYDKAMKALLAAEIDENERKRQAQLGGEGWRYETAAASQLRSRIENLKARLADRKKSMNPQQALALADDFGYLAAKGGFSPEVSKGFIDAAQHLRQAYEGEQLLTKERAPGGALALTQPELAARKADIEGRLSKLTEEQKTVGQFRAPELKEQLGAVQKERQNVKQYERSLKPVAPSQEDDIQAHVQAGGRSVQDFKGTIVGAAKQVEMNAGKELGNLDEEVPFDTALRTLIPVLDKDGRIAADMSKILKGMRPSQQESQPQKPAEGAPMQGPDPALEEIRQKQDMRRRLFQEISQGGYRHTWLSAIAFVLMSALIGVEKASRLWGMGIRNGTLKPQLDALSAEIREDISLYQQNRREQERRRSEAAKAATKGEARASDDARWLQREILQHYLIMERAKQRGLGDGQSKKLSSLFSTYARMMDNAEQEKARADEVITGQSSLYANPEEKKSAYAARKEAIKAMDFYKDKMVQLSEQLKESLGIELQAAPK